MSTTIDVHGHVCQDAVRADGHHDDIDIGHLSRILAVDPGDVIDDLLALIVVPVLLGVALLIPIIAIDAASRHHNRNH